MPRSDYEFFVLLLNRAGADRHLYQSPERLHTAFYHLKSRYGNLFPPLAKLHFITAGAFPYSPDLTDALDVLQLSGASSKENPSFERFAPKTFEGLDQWLLEAGERIAPVGGDQAAALQSAIDELSEALASGD